MHTHQEFNARKLCNDLHVELPFSFGWLETDLDSKLEIFLYRSSADPRGAQGKPRGPNSFIFMQFSAKRMG